MEKKLIFTCSICDKEYDNPMDRAKCELACCKKQEEEVKKMAEIKKKEEQMARLNEVHRAYDIADGLRDKYVEDYGVYARANTRDLSNATVGDIFKLFM